MNEKRLKGSGFRVQDKDKSSPLLALGSKQQSSIVITGGGTGGHLSIAKALKEELNAQGVKPIFIGSTNGQDKAWFENDEKWSAKYFF
jgi:UDP-N-acetylglucosamine--N-acetylmuramyl-(pentapeptide) pyrophosphoryl-undecaprenol N-acetylglucosamine transferase